MMNNPQSPMSWDDPNAYRYATCMLVLHFVQGLPQKRELLRRIAGHLARERRYFWPR